MECAASRPELSGVSDLLDKRMPKCIPATIRCGLSLQQFGTTQRFENGLDLPGRCGRKLFKHLPWKLLAYDGGNLQNRFVGFTKSIDTGSNNGLDRGRKHARGCYEAKGVVAWVTNNAAILRERAHKFLGKERISATSLRHSTTHVVQFGSIADQFADKCNGLCRREIGEQYLVIV